MKQKLLSSFKILFFLGLGFFLIWLVLDQLTPDDKEKIKRAFLEANYLWLIPSGIFALASHYSRAIRWRMLLKPMGYNPSSVNLFLAVMVGYLANLAVPRLGEVSRCGILQRYEKIPLHKSVGTVVTERAFDLLTLVLLFVFVFITQFQRLGTYANEFIIDPIKSKVIGSSTTLFIMALVVGIVIFALYALKERIKQLAFLQRIIDVIRGFLEGLKSIRNLESPGLFIAHSLFIWTMYLMMLFVCFYCLKETSVLGLSVAFSVLAFGSLGMIATPGGIGAYPPIIRGVLGLYAIDANIGLALGWIAWSAQTILIVLVGFISLSLLPILNRPADASSGVNTVQST